MIPLQKIPKTDKLSEKELELLRSRGHVYPWSPRQTLREICQVFDRDCDVIKLDMRIKELEEQLDEYNGATS